MNIIFIGAGNLATHLARACRSAGHTIFQIYSRTMENAMLLAAQTGAEAVDELSKINPTADLYIFSVKDDILPVVIQKMPQTEGVWAHTAGSLPMQLFAGHKADHGVMYPLQTFSKNRELNFSSVPVFIEGSNPASTRILEKLADSLTRKVYMLTGDKRRHLHLAAVYACNFVNHMYTLASEITEKEELPFDVLLPLITETAAKVGEMPPRLAQTGPAVRYDEEVMKKHLSMLNDSVMKEIYRLVSKSIHQHST
ncbi:MAG: DUF2520 domain-containing protein [Porphyromonadaceae bacterium]|nr:DUF2520 domain-containing protein [Porphyromonadaceae bacterium]